MRSATVLSCLPCGCVPAIAQEASLKLTQHYSAERSPGSLRSLRCRRQRPGLFVAALGNNSLEVIDLAAGKRIQSVPGMSKPTGVLYLPDLKSDSRGEWRRRHTEDSGRRGIQVLKNVTSLDDADNLRLMQDQTCLARLQ